MFLVHPYVSRLALPIISTYRIKKKERVKAKRLHIYEPRMCLPFD